MLTLFGVSVVLYFIKLLSGNRHLTEELYSNTKTFEDFNEPRHEPGDILHQEQTWSIKLYIGLSIYNDYTRRAIYSFQFLL